MAEKRTIEVEIKSNSQNLKQQLREAQKEVEKLSEKFGATSQEAINAAKKAAELKDAIGAAKDLTDAFNPDAKFNALSNSIGGVLNGFQAFEGVMGLVGVESSKVEEALLKVQSAMALSQGIQGLLEAKDAFIALKAVIASTAVGQKLLTAVTWVQVTAQKALNFVMKQNPVMLIVAGVIALTGAIYGIIKAIDFFSDSTEKASVSNEKLNKTLERQDAQMEKNFNRLKRTNDQRLAMLEATGASEEKLHKERIRQLDEEDKKIQARITREKDVIDKKYKLYKKAIAEEDEETAKSIRESIKEREKQYAELSIQHQEYINNKLLENAKYDTEEKKAAEAKAKEENEKAKERIKQFQEKRKEELDKLRGFIKEASDYTQSQLRSDLDNEIATINEKYSERLALAKKLGKGEAEIREALLNEINDVKTKYAQEEIRLEEEKQEKINQVIKDAEKQRLDDEEAFYEEYRQNTLAKTDLEIQDVNDKYFRLIEEAKQYGLDTTELERRRQEEINKIDEESKEQQKARVEELKQARLKAVQTDLETSENGLKSIQNLFETFQNIKFKKIKEGSAEEEKRARQQFKFNKALQLGLAIIDGAKAVTASLAQSPIAIGPVPNPAGIASLATAVSSSALSIAKIASMQFDAGGGGSSASAPSGGGASGGGGQVPNFNIVGNSTANQLAQVEQKPVQAFVVSGEVTSAQALDRNRQVNATFG